MRGTACAIEHAARALVLLNDPTFVEAARVLAQRTIESAKVDGDRLEFAFRQVTARAPDETEAKLSMKFLERSRAHFGADPKAAEELVKIGLAPRPEKVDARELASWIAVCRALLNLNETITRE